MDGSGNHHDTPITVQGWSERYARAFEELLGIEGGFVDDPVDRGGATKYGISLRFLKAEGAIDEDGASGSGGFRDFDLDFDGDIDGRDVRKLTVGDARYLYLKHFWQPLDCEIWPAPIGEMLFDQGVNGGNLAAKKLLQRALNMCLARIGFSPIVVDGQPGPATRGAFNRVVNQSPLGIKALVEAYREAVRDRYRAIVARNPSQRRFLKGWLRRADELGR